MTKRTRELLVYAKELTTKDGNRKFLVYSTKIGDKYFDVKFSSKCNKRPTSVGYFDVLVEEYFTKPNGEYNDILWVCKASKVEVSKYIKHEVDPLAYDTSTIVF